MFIKGFDEELKCRGFQFEVGKTYDTGADDEELELCSDKVFHFCRNLEKVHRFYSVNPKENNRFCEIEVLGGLIEDGEKCGSNKIKIVREITGQELADLKGLKNGNTGLFNAGDCNTGDCNTGDCNTGSWNTGERNTGDCNAGDCNIGNGNTGNWNTENWNTGNCNTGSKNTGDRNTGDWNTCNRSTGLFNTKERTITIFNKDSGLTWDEIVEKDWHIALNHGYFKLTEWVEYTEEEKKDSIIRQCIGGYLKKYTFKEACQNWWKSLSSEDKELIQTIPNFDKEIFEEITGIKL